MVFLRYRPSVFVLFSLITSTFAHAEISFKGFRFACSLPPNPLYWVSDDESIFKTATAQCAPFQLEQEIRGSKVYVRYLPFTFVSYNTGIRDPDRYQNFVFCKQQIDSNFENKKTECFFIGKVEDDSSVLRTMSNEIFYRGFEFNCALTKNPFVENEKEISHSEAFKKATSACSPVEIRKDKSYVRYLPFTYQRTYGDHGDRETYRHYSFCIEQVDHNYENKKTDCLQLGEVRRTD